MSPKAPVPKERKDPKPVFAASIPGYLTLTFKGTKVYPQ